MIILKNTKTSEFVGFCKTSKQARKIVDKLNLIGKVEGRYLNDWRE